MMKQVKCKFPVRILTLILGLFLTVSAFAQSTITGQVKDAAGEPIIGASVLINGTSNGTMTDLDGNFSINAKPGATLTVSYIGFQKQQVAAANGMVITLKEDQAQQMNEVVVIGYGAVKKSDLTGSVTALKPDSKNKGLVVNAQDMLSGKVAGVSVTSDGGSPGGGANIRIRGGSSLSASNNPLIVIDGVAMDQTGIKGVSNPLSLVNPQDIESFNVLKDASATAIYGSRGSNGVIIITTKKGRRGMQVSYNGSFTVSRNSKNYDVLSADEYRSLIGKKFGTELYTLDANGNKVPTVYSRLGNANTNWQNEIFRTALSHDHNIAVSGQVGNWLPYRVSAGYTNQQGIVKTSEFERFTGAVTLSPSLLDDHLKLTLNAKGMWTRNRFADGGAIGAARQFDPTQPVYASGKEYENFGGYFQWLSDGSALNDKTWPMTYYNLATKNPVSMLNLKNERSISRDFLGSADLDYKVHGFEDLRLHVTAGLDIAKGRQTTDIDPASPLATYYGFYGWETQLKRNMQLSAYAQYYHDFNDKAKNHFDIMAGYEWAHFWHNTKKANWSYYPSTNNDAALAGTQRNYSPFYSATENYLVSFFGRANWSLMDGRYMVTATVRDDGSSRFKSHWAMFPSFAFAWRINEENEFKKIDWLSDLKLRLSWGMTGQQEGIGDYNYFAVYKMNSGVGSYYPVAGDGSMGVPQAYDPDLKWETTTSYNIGVDWGILKQRFTGSVDWYYRKTTDLLNIADVPAGSNFRNKVTTNIGSMYNTGVETSLHWLAVNTKDFNWTMDYNFTYNYNIITKLNGGNDPDYFVATGGISAGVGGEIQAQHVGSTINSFHVFQQAYDKNGNALEGVVVDRNADGKITDADKYYYKAPAAPVTMGFASRFEYRNWDLGFALRASLGNYVYNDAFAGTSNMSNSELYPKSMFLVNRPTDVIGANWASSELTSIQTDYWVHNASFLKMDNVTLGYSFANLLKQGAWNGLTGRVYGTVNNVFCLTKYRGLDPEVFNGIDNNLYPRPISFILGLNLNF